MKIKQIGLNNYGKFGDDGLNVEFHSGLNVVMGNNEAGKSTLKTAIGELLYGFQSKKHERHPYSTRGAMKVHGSIYEPKGELIQLQRSFDKNSEGKMIIGSHVSEIGNVALEDIGSIPFLLYKGLFELDLSELAKLDGQKWSEVEEQISLQYGLANMLTPQHILSQLESEMHLLWRPHNRGKYAVKDIDESLNDLKEKRRDIIRKRSNYKERELYKKSLQEDVEKISEIIEEKKAWLSGAEEQMTAFRQYAEMQKIDLELRSYEYGSLKAEDYSYLMRENENIKEEKASIENEIHELQTSKVQMNGFEKELTEMSLSTSEFNLLHMNFMKERTEYHELRDELKGMKKILENKSLELTADPWNDALMNYWRSLNIRDLDKALRRKKLFSFSSVPLWILVLSGAALGAAGYYYADQRFMIAGGATSALSFLGMMGSFNRNPFEFMEIQFRNGIWKKREIFLEACDKIKILIEGYIHKAETVEEQKEVYKKLKDDLETILGKFSFEDPATIDSNAYEVLKQLESTAGKIQANKIYENSLSALNARKRKIGHALLTNQQKLNAFRNELSKFSATPEEGLRMLERFSALEHRRSELAKSLAEFDRESEYNEYRHEPEFEGKAASVKMELESLRAKREEMRIELTAIDREEERRFEDQRLDGIEAQIEKLSLKREQSIDAYNKLRMIHSIISYADEAFRKKYQPNLMRRASKLLTHFTNGHYDTIVSGGHGQLQINDTKMGHFIPVHDHLSRGTLEQVYLAMRIAVAETIEQKLSGKIPLILDEVFVNWDHDRLSNALNTIQKISEERQVVYLTCHEWMAEKLIEEHGAYSIRL